MPETISVLNMFSPGLRLEFSSYCGLVDPKIRASDKDLPVYLYIYIRDICKTRIKKFVKMLLIYFFSLLFFRIQSFFCNVTLNVTLNHAPRRISCGTTMYTGEFTARGVANKASAKTFGIITIVFGSKFPAIAALSSSISVR